MWVLWYYLCSIVPVRVWLWISTPRKSTDSFVPDYKQSKVSTEGPEWDTEINADVIVEILNTSTKEKYFLVLKNQEIERPE